MPWRANGSMARWSAPGWWSVTKENAVRHRFPFLSSRMCVAIETNRVYASGWSPTSAAITVSPYSFAARSLAIAASDGLPCSATCAAASPVVAAAMAVARGMDASSRRHWSSATGCEWTTRMSSSATSAGPTRR